MINFIVCDDNDAIRLQIEEIINKFMMKNNYEYKIYLFDDYNKKFFDLMEKQLVNKIYILDIETPSQSGINIARKIRSNDIPDKTYFFVSREEFEKKINDGVFLEYAEYNGNYYGTPRDKISEKLNQGLDVILEIEIQGALKVKELVSDAIFIFILPPSMDELRKRLVNRGTDSMDKILNRFKRAYQEINEITKYNYVVINDEVDKAVSKVHSIMLSERCRVDRIEEVYLNNMEEEVHELLVDKDLENIDRDI